MVLTDALKKFAILTKEFFKKQILNYSTLPAVKSSGNFLFLSDPGKPGVRSLGPDVTESLREVCET